MAITNLKAAEANEPTHQELRAEAFANYVALIITDRRTPRAVKDALAAIIVEDIANSSSYVWDADAEGLRFLLPRLLNGLNEVYAEGVVRAALTVAGELLPEHLRHELWHRNLAEMKG